MNASPVDQPSPAHDACACVAAVCPSTADESYDNPTLGTSDDAAGGTTTGYEYVNAPETPPAAHVPEGFSDVAAYDPAVPPSCPAPGDATSTTVFPAGEAPGSEPVAAVRA